MKLVFSFIALLGVSPLHADVKFDQWKFSELLVTGLKAARTGQSHEQQRSLDDMQEMLAEFNHRVDRKYRRRPEKGLACARKVLLPQIQEAWSTEADERGAIRQREFLARVLALGLGPNMSIATERLSQRFFDDHWSNGIFLIDHAALISSGLAAVAGAGYVTWGHGPTIGLMILTGVGAGLFHAVGSNHLAEYNKKNYFKYEANYVGRAFRECELDLLRALPNPPNLGQ